MEDTNLILFALPAGDSSGTESLKRLSSVVFISETNKSYKSPMNDGRLKTLYIKTERQRDKENENTRDKQRDKIKAGGGWRVERSGRWTEPIA